jgi:hypothetical protein
VLFICHGQAEEPSAYTVQLSWSRQKGQLLLRGNHTFLVRSTNGMVTPLLRGNHTFLVRSLNGMVTLERSTDFLSGLVRLAHRRMRSPVFKQLGMVATDRFFTMSGSGCPAICPIGHMGGWATMATILVHDHGDNPGPRPWRQSWSTTIATILVHNHCDGDHT